MAQLVLPEGLLPEGVVALEEVARERARQLTVKEYDPEHDDCHEGGELALAGALYTSPIILFDREHEGIGVRFFDPWPWDEELDKRPRDGEGQLIHNETLGPGQRRRQLVKAAALILAEIERLARADERDAAELAALRKAE